jgi:LysM repeat protein
MQLNFLTINQQPAIGEQLYLQAPAPAAPRLSDKKNTASTEQQAVTEPIAVTSASELEIHVVQPKETLYSISKKYEVTQAQIQQWNNLTGTDLKEGMELIINK